MGRKIDPIIHFEMPANDTNRVRAFYESAGGPADGVELTILVDDIEEAVRRVHVASALPTAASSSSAYAAAAAAPRSAPADTHAANRGSSAFAASKRRARRSKSGSGGLL